MLYRYTKQHKIYIVNNEFRHEILNLGALKMLRNHEGPNLVFSSGQHSRSQCTVSVKKTGFCI
jgi:hypothetical protein